MNLTKSSNPIFGDKVYRNNSVTNEREKTMTFYGTVTKTILLFLLVVLGASYTWSMFFRNPESNAVLPFMITGAIGGLILAFVISFKPKSARFLAPVYAILEGLFIGGISAFYTVQTGGIVMKAVLLTVSVFAVMLFLYRTGVIKVTKKFRAIIISAISGIAMAYLVTILLSFFGINLSFMYDSSPLSIIISLVVIAIAALSLALDFDFIERGVKGNAPAYLEWYGAFGIMVTLIWLYLEILRLLAKLRD
jgi:uncharacterized YccA/Bax inhibitor family protein